MTRLPANPAADPARNAAIYFAADGYDPKAKGINGRRVAGESFLRGYLRHADAAEIVSLTPRSSDEALFSQMAIAERPALPHRAVALRNLHQMAPLGTLFYPSPNFAAETWRRAPFGHQAWSICGITHTTSTKGVMQGFYDLRMAQQMEWDAVICTSRAVLASVLHQFELIDLQIRQRFGGTPPARPQLPVIPLGVDTAAFGPDAAAGAALRKRLGVAKTDVIFATIARLTPYEKFDPLPVYLALQAAQAQMPKGTRLHLALCGIYRDDLSRKVFEDGARRLMPDVGFHVLDGADARERHALLSGADAFAFVIDNIQETFGLAPIEAMAAGLPVLCSDWDGMRDTVTPETGIRVPTRSLTAAHAEHEGYRHLTGTDNYVQYCAQASAMTEVEMPALIAAIVTLAKQPDLRRRMGEAGRKRAQEMYDWARIVPQMQDLWQELGLRRRAALTRQAIPRAALPVGPSPFALFAAWPSRQGGLERERFIATDLPHAPQDLLALRNYMAQGRQTERTDLFVAVHHAIRIAGAAGETRDGLATSQRATPVMVDRVLIWLLKYGLIRRI
ncbi:glycosyltransferase family 4 protein [Gemmobacter serpentinus]|uniref:glycosyltransferase family 4 protein n=1 Tax=Gemmobacter serpentinus TaxID=2652247 RepID=UPI00186582A5|nr:glycosyltransferase family 4 protein [Gemmobacter serpentinus]